MIENLHLLPLLLYQGIRVGLTTPRLPEAPAPFTGEFVGEQPSLHLVVIGESTVAGVGAPSHEQALTGQVARALHKLSKRHIQWQVIGKNGATAVTTRRQLLPNLKPTSADIIVIALGVNDTTHLHTPTRWKRDLHGLIMAIRERVGTIPIAISAVPPVAEFPVLPQPLRRVLGQRALELDRGTRELVATMPTTIHIPFPVDMAVSDAHFCEDSFCLAVVIQRLV